MIDQREAIARTIYRYHGIKVDPNKHTWEEMSELYQRLCTAENIKKYHGIDIDWKSKTAPELRDMYFELNAKSFEVT